MLLLLLFLLLLRQDSLHAAAVGNIACVKASERGRNCMVAPVPHFQVQATVAALCLHTVERPPVHTVCQPVWPHHGAAV